MKRDMDFIRELLFKLEGLDFPRGGYYPTNEICKSLYTSLEDDDDENEVKFEYHFELLKSDDYFLLHKTSGGFKGLNQKANDFLDSVRDPITWEKTKKAANAAGGFSVDLLKDIAKGFIKKQVEEYSGIKIS